MTNGERINTLHREILKVQRTIEVQGREGDYLEYLREVAENKTEPSFISEMEWEIMLPKEQDTKLIPYYHSLRTEYLQMKRSAETPTTMQAVQKWLEQPWMRVLISAGTLAEVALIILHLLSTTGQFLLTPEADPLQV